MKPSVTNKLRIFESGSQPFLIGVTVAAVFFGLVDATAAPLIIGLSVGLVAGIFFGGTTEIRTIWLILGLGLSTGTAISLAGSSASQLPWAVSMLGFLLMLPTVLSLPGQRDLPAFLLGTLALMFFSVGCSLLQWHSTAEFFAASNVI